MNIFLVVIGLVVLGAVALMPYAWGRQKREAQTFRDRAQALGLNHRPATWRSREALEAQIGERSLVITWSEEVRTRTHGDFTSINSPAEVRYQISGFPPDLVVARAGLGAAVLRAVSGTNHRTGDSAFDAVVELRGDRPSLDAFLDPDLRRHIQALVENGASIQRGTLSWILTGPHRLLDHPGRIDLIKRAVEAFDRATARPTGWRR